MSAVPLSSKPAAGQLIEHDGTLYATVQEGLAFILTPPNTQTSVNPKANKNKQGTEETELKRQNVFYNPIQQFNRDLSVLAIKAYSEDWLVRKKSKDEKNKGRTNARRSRKRKFDQLRSDEQGEEGAKVARLDHAEEAGGDGNHDPPAVTTPLEAASKEGNTAAVPQSNGDNHAQPGRPRFRILDALSATGLRALRYAKEIPIATSIVANDMSPSAVQSMRLNIEHNGLSSIITPNIGDAIGHMYSVAYPPPSSHGPSHVTRRYDVIDLDPYGTAAPFLDAALQALNDGGLLCVTCTDSGVFASCGYSEKTYALYGGIPIKGLHSHEGGIRLIINAVATAGAKYGLSVEPLLSLSIDFYIRTFIRIRKSPLETKFLAGKTMVVYSCDAGCGAWTTQPLVRNTKNTNANGEPWYKHTIAQAPGCDRICQHCGSKTHVAGPMWGGPIHNAAFVEKMLDDLDHADPEIYRTKPRMEGMLHTALEELLVNDVVTKYTPPAPGTVQSLSTVTAPMPISNGNIEPVLADAAGAADSEPALLPQELVPQVPPSTLDHAPFFFNPSALSKVVHCQAPSDAAIRGALRSLGYRTTRSHCQAGSIKTEAPWPVIWEVMREWVRQRSPIKEGKLREGSAGWKILQSMRKDDIPTVDGSEAVSAQDGEATPDIITEEAAATTETSAAAGPGVSVTSDIKKLRVVFDEALGRDKATKKLVRYQMNPRENWGPMARAKGKS